MKILVSYRGIPQSPGWATGDMVVKAFRELGHTVFPYAKYYQQNNWVEDRAFGLDDHDFDLILFMECNDGDPQYPELKVTRARKTACWLFDTSYHADRYKRLVDYFRFDHLFLANPLTIQEYKLWGYDHVSYLPYACDSELHGRPMGYPKTMDVALVGSVRDDRRRLVAELASLGVNVELIGDVFREDYIDALAESEYVINQNPDAGAGLFNMRQFEAPAAGSIIFTEGRDYDANEGEFQHLVNCVVYRSPQELVEIIRALDADQQGKENLRIAGQNHVFKHHTYEARCEEILSLMFPNG